MLKRLVRQKKTRETVEAHVRKTPEERSATFRVQGFVFFSIFLFLSFINLSVFFFFFFHFFIFPRLSF